MIAIREERPEDVSAIRKINIQAFEGAEEADIVDSLRENCKSLLSLVATQEDRAVGHILFSPATIESGSHTVQGMGLAPMAVLPDLQRQGIGSELVRVGLSKMRERNTPFVIVVGHAEYYPRFGFMRATEYGVRCQWEVPDDVFMMMVLDEAAMKDVAGLARYRPEFGGGEDGDGS